MIDIMRGSSRRRLAVTMVPKALRTDAKKYIRLGKSQNDIMDILEFDYDLDEQPEMKEVAENYVVDMIDIMRGSSPDFMEELKLKAIAHANESTKHVVYKPSETIKEL